MRTEPVTAIAPTRPGPPSRRGCCIAILLWAAAATAQQAGPPPQPRNLQVLPAHTSAAEVADVMAKLNRALGVDCAFCHEGTDYASDAPAMKRHVRRALADQKEWNEAHNPGKERKLTCYRCHLGQRIPDYQHSLNERDQLVGLAFMMAIAGGENVTMLEALAHIIDKGRVPGQPEDGLPATPSWHAAPDPPPTPTTRP